VYVSPANLFVANFIGSPSMNFIPCKFEASAHGVQIQINGEMVQYRLPMDIKQSVSGIQDGMELILGIRPEDVYIHTNTVEDGLECQLVLIEALGSENIHHLQRGNLHIVSRTSPADVYPEGQSVWVTFETAGIGSSTQDRKRNSEGFNG
jgi:multiple sugar transport system ATP-binding protein